MRNRKYSDCDSSEEEDEVNFNYFERMRMPQASKSVENFKPKLIIKRQDVEEPEDEPQFQLKPKLITEANANSPKVMANNSGLSQQSQFVSRRPLTAAYTFKLKTPVNKRKKSDPVSLFQQTSQAWKKDKFLTNRANNKEGRKLQLDKRNKQANKF